MDTDAIIARLRTHETRLKEMGIESVSLFGSSARGEAETGSDIDLAVRLSPDFSHGGFDYFARIDALRRELASVLNSAVDLVEEPVRRPELRAEIERDRVIAFQ